MFLLAIKFIRSFLYFYLLLVSSSQLCPECKQPIPPGGVRTCPRNLFIVGLIGKIHPETIEMDVEEEREMGVDEEREMDGALDTPVPVEYFIHEMYSAPVMVLHLALRALEIPFDGANFSYLSMPNPK